MKRITLRLIIALLTFLIGVTLVTFWIVKRQRPSQTSKTSPGCIPVFDPKFYSGQENGWGAVVLARFHEMPLENFPSCVDESYRLIWIPTFHSPVAARIWRSGDKRFLVAKQLDGKGGYGMGNLALEEARSITEDEWLTFIRLLDQASYWEMPSIDAAPPPNDGAAWVIEGAKERKYHNVNRHTPSIEFRASCAYLLKLSGIKTEYERY